MYLYCLPLAQSSNSLPSEMIVPTPDGGVEHTAATFAPAQSFLTRQLNGQLILFPPQAYLCALIAQHISASDGGPEQRALERDALIAFLESELSGTRRNAQGQPHWTSKIRWADKVMSPYNLFTRKSDGRIVLGLDKPGVELQRTGRGGDGERVALVKFTSGGPRDVEIRDRQEVLDEEHKDMEKTKL